MPFIISYKDALLMEFSVLSHSENAGMVQASQ